MKNAAIVCLVLASAFLTYRLAEVENQRYALLTGLCANNTKPAAINADCLAKAETRTHMLWHVYYGLKG